MSLEEHSNPHDRSSSLATALLLAVAALWCLYWFVHAWNYWEDDAYIHLEFARSVAAGRGFAFDGKVVAGDTAPLWVLLLAAMHALTPDWLVAGKALTVLGAALGLSGAYAFARSLASQLRLAAIFPAAMVLLIVVNPYSCYWLFSGMEPFAASGVAFFAVLAATRERPTCNTFLAGCLLAGIAPLLRPEMIFLTALLLLPLLGQWRRLDGSSTKLAAFASGLLLLVTPLATWSLYSLHAFGHVFPNTNAAKRAGPNDSVVRHLLTIYSLAFPLIVCGLLAGIVYLALRPSAVRDSLRNAVASAFRPKSLPSEQSQSNDPQPSASLPFAGWIFIFWPAVAAVFYVINHTYVQTRYILVTAPGLTIVIVALALLASQRLGRILYIAALVAALVVSIVTVRPFLRNKAINCQNTRALAHFIRDHIPPDAPVATYSIGQIVFDSEHPIVDTGGITQPGALPYLNAPHRVMVRWAKSQGAQYNISTLQPEPGAVSVCTTKLMYLGWTLHTSLYATSAPLSLWKLTPLPEPVRPPASSFVADRP
jgi:MFS family permease